MNKSEILAFCNENPVCFLANVEDGKPRVRCVALCQADESGILFQTYEPKDLCQQLLKNKEVEVCFNSGDKDIQIRVSGQMELVEDLGLKRAMVEKRPFMKPVVDEKGYDFVKLFRLVNGRAHVWTREVNFDPKTYVAL